jgi:hypothetical protein
MEEREDTEVVRSPNYRIAESIREYLNDTISPATMGVTDGITSIVSLRDDNHPNLWHRITIETFVG